VLFYGNQICSYCSFGTFNSVWKTIYKANTVAKKTKTQRISSITGGMTCMYLTNYLNYNRKSLTWTYSILKG